LDSSLHPRLHTPSRELDVVKKNRQYVDLIQDTMKRVKR
jgi:hypothetical protein